jgi:hypothetical protein
VTPPAYGKFTRTAVIDPSHFDAAVAYVAANRYQQDDFRPYLWKTTDYGKTWTPITNGIPVGAYTRTIREDPKRRGLLYTGTEAGVYVSFNDGASWEPLQLNLPRASVRDLRVHDNDLIAATHGRGMWIMDDLSILRTMADSITAKATHLFPPAKAIRWAGGRGRGALAGENPPSGAYIDYWFKDAPKEKVTLEFLDAAGKVIRSYYSKEDKPDSATKYANDSLAKLVDAARRDSVSHEPADSLVSIRPGSSRFVWSMRYPGAKELKNTVLDEGNLDGPVAPPGRYAVRLILGKDTTSRSFDIIADPRVKTPTVELVAQFEAALRVRDRLNDVVEGAQRIEDIQGQLDARTKQSTDQAFAKRVAEAAKALRVKLEAVRAELYEVGCHVDQCTLDQPVKLYNQLISLNYQVQQGDYAPTKQHGEIHTDLSGRADVQLKKLQQLEDTELSAFNKLLEELKIPGVYVPVKKVAS